jgi:hypothetical protein
MHRLSGLALGCASLVWAAGVCAAPAPNHAAPSRAQVAAELCRAEQAGLVPMTDTGPPDAWTIAHNKALFKASGLRCPAASPASDVARSAHQSAP